MGPKFSKYTYQNAELIKHLDPLVREIFFEFMLRLAMRGIYVRFTSGTRTVEEQDYLYSKGRSRNGRIVTNADDHNSYHTWGLAVDVAVLWRIGPITFKALWAPHLYTEIGYLARELGLQQPIAGDLPHVQYSGGVSIKGLKAGKTPPKPKFIPWDRPTVVDRVVERITSKGIIPFV